jgi:hypothetical protein
MESAKEVPLLRYLRILTGLLLFSALPVFAIDAQASGPGPAAQKIIQLSKAGVEESVILAYIQTQAQPLDVTTDDFGFMKTAGVSPSVLTAIVNHDSRSGRAAPSAVPLTEAQLYRLYAGTVYHEGLTYNVNGGLPGNLKLELESDLKARPYIQSFVDQNGSSQIFNWSGLGLLVGGILYAGISDATTPSNSSLNNTIGLSSVGAGVLSLIVGSVLNATAYQNLYDGLYRYNRDLIVSASGGNP